MIVLRLQFLFLQRQPVVADVVLEGYVHVVGMQDRRRDLSGVSGQPVRIRKGQCGKQQDFDPYRQNQCLLQLAASQGASTPVWRKRHRRIV